MMIHYTLTLKDYIEARAAVGFSMRWLTAGTPAFIGLMVLAIGIAVNAPATTATSRMGVMLLPILIFAMAFLAMAQMQRWQVRHRRDILPRTRVGLMVFAAATAGIGVWLMARAGTSSLLRDSSLFGVLWWAMPLFFILVLGVRMVGSGGGMAEVWKGLEDQHRPKELELLPDGLQIRDGVSSHQLQWQGLRSATESENLFILMANRYSFVIVPKRAFANDEERGQFREAIKAITPPTGGFPVDLPEARLQSPGS